MEALLEKIRKQLKPDTVVLKQVDEAVEDINSLLKKNKLKAECVKGGSVAKGTFLKGDFDVDLFVRFDYSYKDKDLSKLLEKALKPLKPELVHGSRDYFQIKNKDKLVFEIVPVLKINDYKKALNVTDMSPLHVFYVEKHLREKPELAEDIRLAKQFCKANKVYGAESYIKGFSGHVLDILIIYYGSFEQLLMQASVWGDRVILDPEKHLEDPLKALNKAKTHSPLIIVDPIQPDRNAAAALSRERFELFKEAAKKFLHKPSNDFFNIKKLDVNKIKTKETLLVVTATPLKGKDDVVATKLLKVFEKLNTALKKHDFKVLESDWEYSKKTVMYFVVKKERMSDTVEVIGPPVKQKTDAKRFRSKHKKVFEKNNRLFAVEKREFKEPLTLLKDHIKKSYINEKVSAIKCSKR
ncbi:MAG: CCA tRNA nucleotidyltransferase [archaeon]